MFTKEKANQTIKNQPSLFIIDELIDQLIVVEKIEAGIKRTDEGKVISNEDVKSMIEKWSR